MVVPVVMASILIPAHVPLDTTAATVSIESMNVRIIHVTMVGSAAITLDSTRANALQVILAQLAR